MQLGRHYNTSKGLELMAKSLNGTEIQFTRLEFGDGTITNISEMNNMNSLKSPRASFPIYEVEVMYNGEAKIRADVLNVGITENFQVREVGAYAIDKDTGEEVLYSVAYYGDEGNNFRAESVEGIQVEYTINVVIGNVTNLAVNVSDSELYAKRRELKELAGLGRTDDQTVKGAYDLINELRALYNMMLIQVTTGNTSGENIKFLNGGQILETTTINKGIWDKENGRWIG